MTLHPFIGDSVGILALLWFQLLPKERVISAKATHAFREVKDKSP